MRNHELTEGVEVKNKDGEVLGTSVVAARRVCIIIINHAHKWRVTVFCLELEFSCTLVL